MTEMENRFMKPLTGFENKQENLKTEVKEEKPNYMKTLGSPETTEVTGNLETQVNSKANQESTVEESSDSGEKYSFEIRHLNHTFDVGTEHEFKIFDDFCLQVEDIPEKSEVITLMGGSGCGKSCILRMAAGLMTPQEGDIRILGQHIDQYKSVPMVFQSYSSFEWMTVLDNVALPMVLHGTDKKSAREKAYDILSLVGLEQHATKYAKASVLSGGQLQRVSIARCLASDSPVFFLDEATGALDIKMKREIQDLIIKIASETEHTIVNVTHSVEEALYISDKIFVLKPNPCTIYKEMDISYGDSVRGRWVLDTDTYREYSRRLSTTLDEVCK
jgi:NitT/TauT family transport system ATP-binding protein